VRSRAHLALGDAPCWRSHALQGESWSSMARLLFVPVSIYTNFVYDVLENVR
jgi:hypothetical protein